MMVLWDEWAAQFRGGARLRPAHLYVDISELATRTLRFLPTLRVRNALKGEYYIKLMLDDFSIYAYQGHIEAPQYLLISVEDALRRQLEEVQDFKEGAAVLDEIGEDLQDRPVVGSM